MSCAEAGSHTQRMYQRIMREGISLNAALFYDRLLTFRPEERQELLRQQQKLTQSSALRSWLFARLHGFIDRRLEADLERQLATGELQACVGSGKIHSNMNLVRDTIPRDLLHSRPAATASFYMRSPIGR